MCKEATETAMLHSSTHTHKCLTVMLRRAAELGKTLPLSEAGTLVCRRSVRWVFGVVGLSRWHLEHVVWS